MGRIEFYKFCSAHKSMEKKREEHMLEVRAGLKVAHFTSTQFLLARTNHRTRLVSWQALCQGSKNLMDFVEGLAFSIQF